MSKKSENDEVLSEDVSDRKFFLVGKLIKSLIDYNTEESRITCTDKNFSCSLHANQFLMRLINNSANTDNFFFGNDSISEYKITRQMK